MSRCFVCKNKLCASCARFFGGFLPDGFLIKHEYAIYTPGSSGINVILKPADTAREVGLNVTLACIVTNKATSESVQWKHVSYREHYV